MANKQTNPNMKILVAYQTRRANKTMQKYKEFKNENSALRGVDKLKTSPGFQGFNGLAVALQPAKDAKRKRRKLQASPLTQQSINRIRR